MTFEFCEELLQVAQAQFSKQITGLKYRSVSTPTLLCTRHWKMGSFKISKEPPAVSFERAAETGRCLGESIKDMCTNKTVAFESLPDAPKPTDNFILKAGPLRMTVCRLRTDWLVEMDVLVSVSD